MNLVEIYGWACTVLLIVTHWAESKSYWFILAFAVACVLFAGYGYAVHAWPIVVGELAWAVVATHKWQHHYFRRHH